ncbi:coiled-coil-helix-coiled-coil-helix domain containing 3b isoform X2 [Fundulus heteroclitus]|uniref:coiled-coil-helix-coiled-coil-helix domain containing 3b isoform X2 n=1 Tax=Fundulus heteroclitus TaxID=8078 RepID=UPI00165CDF07|nr:coiled-coil-helix-coiled-coil-helix domain containing 3b isoform X2 [Fundulus heteroclitus]
MGGNSPSRFSAEDDEGGGGGGVTFVKGIRLSDKVIDRMKHSAKASCPHLSPEPQAQVATPVPAPPVEHLLPLLTPPPPQFVPTPPPTPSREAAPTSPSVEAAPPVKLLPPPPVTFHSLPPASLDPAAPPPSLGPEPPSGPSSRPDNPEVPDSLAPPSTVEPIVLPPPQSFILPHKEPEGQTAPQLEEHIKEPVVLAPNWESSPSPEPPSLSCELVTPTPTQPAAFEPLESAAASPPPAETVQVSPSPLDSATSGASLSEVEADPLVEGVRSSSPPEPCAEGASPPCQCDDVAVVHTRVPGNVPPPELEPPPPNEPRPVAAEPPGATFLPPVDEEEEPATVPSPAAGVVEEELRQKIRAELQKSLEEEINQKRQELQQQLEEVRALTRAEATAAAQAQVAQQVRKTLEAERASHMEKLTESIAREKVKAEDEKLMVQLYAHQLEEREKEMKKRDELYKEHVSKLEAKCAEFYKVSSENFQKGKEETQKRFARFNIQPLCGDLQGQILKCYKENPGRTLTCSGIASAYMQCVDNAKKDKRITGG